MKSIDNRETVQGVNRDRAREIALRIEREYRRIHLEWPKLDLQGLIRVATRAATEYVTDQRSEKRPYVISEFRKFVETAVWQAAYVEKRKHQES